MLPSSDSESLPDVATVIASQRRPASPKKTLTKRKTRPASGKPSTDPSSSRPTKKRKLQNAKVKGKARATTPIELSSEDEPPPRNAKPRSGPISAKRSRPKPPLGEVIDLCSDNEDRRPTQKSQLQSSPQEDIIILLSSENETEPISSCTTLPNGAHHKLPSKKAPAPAAEPSAGPSFETAQEEEEEANEDGPMDTNDLSQFTIRPLSSTPPRRPSGSHERNQEPHRPSPRRSRIRRPSESMSPIPFEEQQRLPSPIQFNDKVEVNHVSEPEEPQQRPSPDRVHNQVEFSRSSEPEEPTEPLQSIYNNAFHQTPGPEDTAARRSAFSCRGRLKVHPTTEIHTLETFSLNVSPPPLLTASFFTRARALSTAKVSSNPKSKTTILPPAHSPSQSAIVTVASGEAPSRILSPTARAGSRLPGLPLQSQSESSLDVNLNEGHSNIEGESASGRIKPRATPPNAQQQPSQLKTAVETPPEIAPTHNVSIKEVKSPSEDVPSDPVPTAPAPSQANTPHPQGDKTMVEEVPTSAPTQAALTEPTTPKATSPQAQFTAPLHTPSQQTAEELELIAVHETPKAALLPSTIASTEESTPAPELHRLSDFELSPAARLLMDQLDHQVESDAMVIEDVPVVLSQVGRTIGGEISGEGSQVVVLPIVPVSAPVSTTVEGLGEMPSPKPSLPRVSPDPKALKAPSPSKQGEIKTPNAEPPSLSLVVAHPPPVPAPVQALSLPHPSSVVPTKAIEEDKDKLERDDKNNNDINTSPTSYDHGLAEPDSTNDWQEIADMLLHGGGGSERESTASTELTDEELLAVGLCYPED